MGKIILVSYAGAVDAALEAKWVHAQFEQIASAPEGGIDAVISWNAPKLRNTSFYAEHRVILDQPRGGGYWLWKPYIILEALRRAEPDDVVVYWDVGRNRPNIFRRSIAPLTEWCRQHGGILPGVPILPQSHWTKRDCFSVMGCDEPVYWNATQVQATFSLWSGSRAIQFVSEWLRWCLDRRCLTDDANECGKPNFPGFREHRHDQSVLTNLCVKHRLDLPTPPPIPAGAWAKNINLWSELLDVAGSAVSARPVGDAERQWVASLLPSQFRQRNSFGVVDLKRICQVFSKYEPNIPWVMYLSGMLALREGRVLEGARLLDDATPKLHASFELYGIAADALERSGQIEEALKVFARALPVATPQQRLRVYLALGVLAVKLGDGARAEVAYRGALAINAKCIPAWKSLFELLVQEARHDEAVDAMRQVVRLAPKDAQCHSDLIRAMHSEAGVSQQEIYREHQSWARRHAVSLMNSENYQNNRTPNRKLRVGFISHGFQRRTNSSFIGPLFKKCDRSSTGIEIFCFSRASSSKPSTELSSLVDGWRDVGRFNASKIAEAIRADQIDILIDLSGHGPVSNVPIMALHPAPIRIAYLGNPGIVDFNIVTHCLTDVHLDPPSKDSNGDGYRLIRPFESWVCYAAPEEFSASAISSVDGTQGITFGCLDDPTLVTAEAIQTWCRILQNVPDSRLLLRRNLDSAVLKEAILEAQIDPARVKRISDLSSQEAYFTALSSIDIGLNPFPRHGPLVNCDGFWLGIPHVTLAGDRRDTRAGVSLLANLNLSELIAADEQAYAEIAIRLANDRPRLRELRKTLQERLRASPVMAAEEFTRQFEISLRLIWEKWCGAVRPA